MMSSSELSPVDIRFQDRGHSYHQCNFVDIRYAGREFGPGRVLLLAAEGGWSADRGCSSAI